MALKFNGTNIESIIFTDKGVRTSLDKVTFNGVTVWENVKYIFNKGIVQGQGVLFDSYDVHLAEANNVSSSINRIDENGNWVLGVTCNNNSYPGWIVSEFMNLDMVTYSKIVIEYDFAKGESYNRELFQIVWGVGDYENFYTQAGAVDLKDQKLVIDLSNRKGILRYFNIKVGVVGSGLSTTLTIKKIYLEK